MAKRGRKKKASTSKPKEEESTPVVAEGTQKAEPKQRGRKSSYTEEQKIGFLDAIKNGRKADAPWSEIFDAVKTQGFKGGLPYLQKMAADAGMIKTRGRKGRPKGSKNAPKTRGPGRPKGSMKRTTKSGASLGDIESIVAKMVEDRVSAVMTRAVEMLERTTDELRNL